MTSAYKLFEGMMPGDLEDLVSTLISIDEFDSKIDSERAIVVGFHVNDEAPAKDLSRFIEKSEVPLLDTEVSPAPDTNGKYVVFIEFHRDLEFPKNLMTILASMVNITGLPDEEYTFTAYKVEGEKEVNEKNLRKFIRLEPNEETEETEENEVSEEVLEFLEDSILDDACLANKILILEKYAHVEFFKFVDFGEVSELFSKYKLENKSFKLEESKKYARIMHPFLGSEWATDYIDSFLLLQKPNASKALLLKPLP
jgi:hypothetical protein